MLIYYLINRKETNRPLSSQPAHKLDVDPGAGIKDVANVNPNTPLSATLDGTSDSSISVDKSTIEPGGKTPSSATTEDTASSASSETPEPAAEPVAAVAPENADKAAKTQALEAKVADKTATAEDIKALRELKADPAQHRADLEQKALDGTITDAEADELGQLNTSETTSSQTPEQQAEELMKREGLGTSTEEGLAGLSTEQREQIQKAFEDMFKDVDKARKQDEERKREMKRLQREMQRLREQNKRLADQVKELNEKLDAAASEHAPEYKKAA
jgi:chromosome segregation ATPase